MSDPSPASASNPVRGTLATLSLAMLLPSLGTSIANVALPTLAQEFGGSFQQVQWIVLGYLLGMTSLIVGVGRLGDMVGRRRLLLGGIVLFTVASAACAFAPTLGGLIAARAAQGVGAAILMALSLAFVGGTVPKERTGRVMGLLGTMSAVGTAMGPSLGGVLIASFGWSSIFLINLPLGAVAFLLAYRCLPTDKMSFTGDRKRFDIPGTVLLAVTLAAYALAVTFGKGHFGPVNVALLAAAAAGFVLFIFVETRTKSPLIRLAMLRDPKLSIGLALSALVSTVLMATLVVGPFYLARSLGLSAALVGIAMSVGPAVAAMTGVPAGRATDRFGTGRMTFLGLLGVGTGSLLLALMPHSLGIAGYIAPLAVMTASYALFQTANNTSVMKDVAADSRGVVSGLLNLSRNLGLVTGASVMGAVFALASGADDVATAQADAVAVGMRATFAVAALLIAVAIGLVLAGRRLVARGRSGRRDFGGDILGAGWSRRWLGDDRPPTAIAAHALADGTETESGQHQGEGEHVGRLRRLGQQQQHESRGANRLEEAHAGDQHRVAAADGDVPERVGDAHRQRADGNRNQKIARRDVDRIADREMQHPGHQRRDDREGRQRIGRAGGHARAQS
jgi:EmrB/QacA subfamily drug resistance transporter